MDKEISDRTNMLETVLSIKHKARQKINGPVKIDFSDGTY